MGLERWRRERATDYLAQVPSHMRHLVEFVCLPVEDEEERWMCRKRAVRLVARMSPYAGGVGRKEAHSIMQGYNPKDNQGVRIHIVNGTVYGAHKMDGFDDGSGFRYQVMAVGHVLAGAYGSVLRKEHTFDLIVLYEDFARCHAPGVRSTVAAFNTTPVYPIVRYSTSNKGCVQHIPLSWVDAIQDFSRHAPDLPYDRLEDAVFYRGSYYNSQRLHVSLLSALRRVPKLEAGMMRKSEEKLRGSIKQCVEEARGLVAHGHLRDTSPDEVQRLCQAVRGGVWADDVPWDRMRQFRYTLAIDGVGAVLRFPHLMRAPGVVIGVQMDWEENWFPDLVPYVHYMPVTSDHALLEANLTQTLAWLEARPDVAKSVAAESTRWVNKHKTVRTDYREWKMYFEILHSLWNSPPTELPPVHSPIDCETLPVSLLDPWLELRVLRLSCGCRGDDVLGEGLRPEARNSSFLQELQQRFKSTGGGGGGGGGGGYEGIFAIGSATLLLFVLLSGRRGGGRMVLSPKLQKTIVVALAAELAVVLVFFS